MVPRIENLPAPVGNLESYIQVVNRMPMLSAEEEQELAQRLRLRNDLEAAQRLIV
ncbi:MAG: RNA polymerase sigma factor RpoH, partial [Candidatus Competibacteraceae bacterium]|nr:RNA polymerase sigma factor RpoH [Candidatus Competibacteraceae bacterium]